jgi:hypothetical protein
MAVKEPGQPGSSDNDEAGELSDEELKAAAGGLLATPTRGSTTTTTTSTTGGPTPGGTTEGTTEGAIRPGYDLGDATAV